MLPLGWTLIELFIHPNKIIKKCSIVGWLVVVCCGYNARYCPTNWISSGCWHCSGPIPVLFPLFKANQGTMHERHVVKMEQYMTAVETLGCRIFFVYLLDLCIVFFCFACVLQWHTGQDCIVSLCFACVLGWHTGQEPCKSKDRTRYPRCERCLQTSHLRKKARANICLRKFGTFQLDSLATQHVPGRATIFLPLLGWRRLTKITLWNSFW